VSFKKQEFIRIGYYVHNVLSDRVPEKEKSKMLPKNLVKHIRRTILIEKPRITRFKINWEEEVEDMGFFKQEAMKTPAKLIDRLDNSNSLGGSLTHSQDRASSKNSTREDNLELSCLDSKLKEPIQPRILSFSTEVL
jgi:histone chaperone ASF1